MRKTIEIPLLFEFLSSPTSWKVEGEYLVSEVRDGARRALDDGWELRQAFFRLLQGRNTEELADFLNKVGRWGDDSLGHRILQRDISDFNASLQAALQDPKKFPALYTNITRQIRIDGRFVEVQALVAERHFESHILGFDLHTGLPGGVVRTATFLELLLLTSYVDLVKGIKFARCERPDCNSTFPIRQDRERRFCTWYCGHLESIRRKRRETKEMKSRRLAGNSDEMRTPHGHQKNTPSRSVTPRR